MTETGRVDPELSVYKGRKVLVTGGLGFIGSNLARRLLQLGADVTIIDALIPGKGGNTYNISDCADCIDVHIADLRSAEDVARLVPGKEIIFNLAGSVSHLDSMANPILDMGLNCEAHLSLLEGCRRHNREARIVYTGTRAQYGRPLYLPVDEKHPQLPIDVNGIHKMAAEAYHFLYSRIYGMPVCSLRLTNTYGPRQPMRDPRHGFINWLLRLALEGQCLPVYGDGQQQRDLNYVEDVVDALLLAGVAPAAEGQAFNLGSGRPVTVLEVARLLIELTDSERYELVPFPENESKIEIGDYYADCTKVANVLGWLPRVSLQDGLRRTISFFAEARQHYWG